MLVFKQLLTFLKHAVPLKFINNCLNINIIFYLKASGGQISYSYLTAVPFTNTHRYLTEIDFLIHISLQKIRFDKIRVLVAGTNNAGRLTRQAIRAGE